MLKTVFGYNHKLFMWIGTEVSQNESGRASVTGVSKTIKFYLYWKDNVIAIRNKALM